MSVPVTFFDPEERAREKSASRARDQELLASSAVTREELHRINGGEACAIFRTAKMRLPHERRKLRIE